MRTRKVLIIEDDERVRELLEVILEARGFAVIGVSSGEEGLRIAMAEPLHCVLLDLGLPGIQGLDVLELLKSHPHVSSVPVIVVTGQTDRKLVGAALVAGAHDYVRKPFDNEELLARIDGALRSKARHDALEASRDELERLATVDELCGMANRRAMDAELRRQVARAERSERPFALLCIDLDHFKSVNDNHGHACGDGVLREVATRLQSRLRRGDVVGRWGGEEFVVLAPDTSADGAKALAESLREAISEAPVISGGEILDMTASFGFAVWDHETAESLLARADAALYEAKDAGRDLVCGAARRLHAA